MSTLASSNAYTQKPVKTNSISLLTRYNVWVEKLKFSYYGIIAMTITIGSCLGGIATMMVFEHNAPMWQFVVALGLAVGNNVAAIAQAPIKWVVNLFLLNILVNGIILTVNLG